MATDARIAVSLPAHPKTKKLIKKLGDAAAWKLVCLFLWASENRSNGDLDGMTSEDIELAIDWTGDDGAFVAALLAVGFLDVDAGVYSIHDWEAHNPWAAGAAARSSKAKWAALIKRYGRDKAARMMPDYATGTAGNVDIDSNSNIESATGMRLAGSSSAPSPSPSPSPSQEQHQELLPTKSKKVKPEPPEKPKPLVKYGSRLPSNWTPPDALLTWVQTDHPMVDLATERAKFVDYWQAKSGKDATKLDWDATFRNWIRNAKPGINHGNNQSGRRESTSERASRFAREGDQREAARDAATRSAVGDAKVLGEDGGNLRLPLDVELR